jgi:hypothetical protein
MKLPMPTAEEIYKIADRAAGSLGRNRSTDTLIIENAVRNALAVVIDRMNIQTPILSIDLTKQ